MTDHLYRCRECGFFAILHASDVGHGARCHRCTTGYLVLIPHPTTYEWEKALALEAEDSA